ncbi:DUF2505 domain-containing protein [Corynebacterium sphenisci]|uniref:DUF2505 domain-containing protein n=1 Tax=Corynebacterium sphenisci TaxID=191493 RepID=UPI0026E094DE|nr:DUF2505 domain-containing protein [Corynebacterium sphenisci]MDO5730900.1 DUF2505 domain-containing protein [Corynebacterium sphenisci]
MANHADIDVTLGNSPERIHRALASNEYWTHLAENLSDPAGEVVSFDASGENVEVELNQKMPTDALPDAVKSMVKADLTVNRRITWGPLSGDAASATVNAEVKGFPVSFTGTQDLAASGEGATLATGVDVVVNVPMMGAMLEPKVAEAVKAIFEREAKLLDEYAGRA